MLETLKRTKEKIEYNLRIPQYYRKTWIVILVVTLFLLFLSGVGLIIIKVSNWSKSSKKHCIKS